MSTYSDKFLEDMRKRWAVREYAATPEGQRAAQEELAQLTPERLQQIAVSNMDGDVPDEMGEIERLLRSYDRVGLEDRLGEETANALMREFLAHDQEVRKLRDTPGSFYRGANTAINKALHSYVARPFLQGMTAIAQNGLEFTEEAMKHFPQSGHEWRRPRLGEYLASGQALRDFDEAAPAYYDDAYKAGEALNAIRMSADEQKRRALRDERQSLVNPDGTPNTAWNRDWVADAAYIAGGAASGLKHAFFTDPYVGAINTVEAAGAFIPTTGIHRAVTGAAARTILPTAANTAGKAGTTAAQALTNELRALGSKTTQKALETISSGAAGVATGVVAGLNAYGEGLLDVMGRDPEELLQTSEAYRQKVAEVQADNPNLSSDAVLARAQRLLGHEAAASRAAWTGAASTFLGAAFPDMVKSPLKVSPKNGRTRLAEYGLKTGKEMLQEGGEEGSEALIGNITTRAFVDPSQELTAGVGEGIGTGIALGGAMAGGLNAPSAALGSGELMAGAVSAIGERRASRRQARREAESLASYENLNEQARRLSEDEAGIATLSHTLAKHHAETNASEETKAAGTQALSELISSVVVPELPPGVADLDSELQGKLNPGMSRVRAVHTVAQAFNAEEDTEKKTQIAHVLNQLLEPVRRYKEVPEALEALQSSPESRETLQARRELMSGIEDLAPVQKAIAGMQELFKPTDATVAPLVEPKAGDASSQKQAQSIAVQVQIEPTLTGAGVTSQQLEKITLAHGVGGDNTLTEAQRKALEGSIALLRAMEKATTSKYTEAEIEQMMDGHLDGDRTIDSVHRQATTNQNKKHSGRGKESVKQHLNAIVKSMADGHTKRAKAQMERLRGFVMSHNNKIEALNLSQKTGKKTPYKQFVPGKGLVWSNTNPNTKPELRDGVWINRKNPESVRAAETMDAEAHLLTTAYNNLVAAYPELGLDPVQGVRLAQSSKKQSQEKRTKKSTAALPPLTQKQISALTNSQIRKQIKRYKEAGDTDTAKLLAAEWNKRRMEKKQTKEQQSVQSRVTPEAAQKLTDEELNDALNTLLDSKNRSPEDEATFKVLDEEMTRREDEAAAVEEDSSDDGDSGDDSQSPEETPPATSAPEETPNTPELEESPLQQPEAETEIQEEEAETFPLESVQHLTDEALGAEIAELEEMKRRTPNQQRQLEALYAEASRRGDQLLSEIEDENPLDPRPPGQLRKLKDVYSTLWQVPQKWVNHFLRVFTFQKNPKTLSRLAGRKHPIQFLRTALQMVDGDLRMELLGPEGASRLQRNVRIAYYRLLNPSPDSTRSVGAVMKAMNDTLQAKLKKKQSDGLTLEEHIRNGTIQAQSWTRGKLLNIIELEPETNTFRYNQALLEQAVLAGMQWQLTLSQRTPVVKEDQLRESLGIAANVELDSQLIADLSVGIGKDVAKQGLARMVQQFWGVMGKRGEAMGYTDGIPEAMAAEIIDAMQDVDLVKVTPVPLGNLNPELQQEKDINVYTATDWRDADDKLSDVYAYPDLIEAMVLPEREQASYYGEDAKVPLRKGKLNNRKVPTSERSDKAREKLQDQPHYLNQTFYESIANADENTIIRLFGHVISKGRRFNKKHLEALKSKNLVLTGAFNELRKMLMEMQSIADVRGISVYELARKFQYEESSNGRFMMQGAHNGQSNKLMRELMMPTWSTLDLSNQDLTDPAGAHYQYLMLAVAQGLGEKIHRKTFHDNVKWAHDAISEGGHLHAAVQVLAEYLSAKKINSEVAFPVNAYLRALQEAGVENSPLVQMVLLEVARMSIATEAELKAFRTPVYLEADGITNGPFNTMGLLTVGAFSEDWVGNVARGGVAIGVDGRDPPTADQLLKNKRTDLYEAVASAGKSALAALYRNIKSQSIRHPNDQENIQEVMGMAQHVFWAVSGLFPKNLVRVAADPETGRDATWRLERGLTKDLVTQVVYGAGVAGVSSGMVGKMVKELYAILSQLANGDVPVSQYETTLRALAHLMAYEVVEYNDRKTGQTRWFMSDGRQNGLGDPDKIYERMTRGAETFTVSRQEFARMQKNLQILLMGPLRTGAEKVIGPSVFESGKLLVAATQAQAQIARLLFTDAIQQKVEATIERYVERGMSREEAEARVGTEFITKQEVDEAWDETIGTMPFISADNQTFLFTKQSPLKFPKTEEQIQSEIESLLTSNAKKIARAKKRGERPPVKLTEAAARKIALSTDAEMFMYSRSLRGRMRTVPAVKAISDPGVSAIPSINIGMGDARMVREAYQEELPNTQAVFDGINLAIANIIEQGKRINASAAHAWQANVFAAMLESFDRFLADPRVVALKAAYDGQLPSGSRSTELLRQHKNDHIRSLRPNEQRKSVLSQLEDIREQLLEAAQSMQARTVVMSRVPWSIDQMAGPYQPHLSEGPPVGHKDRIDIPPGATDAEIAEILNAAYWDVLAEIQSGTWVQPYQPKGAKSQQEVVKQPADTAHKPKLVKVSLTNPVFVRGTSTRHPSGASIHPLHKTPILAKQLKEKLTLTQQWVLDRAINSKFTRGVEIVTGSVEQIARFQQMNGYTSLSELRSRQPDSELKGLYSPEEKIIYLFNGATVETAVHEIIHAATVELVRAFYEGRLPADSQEAAAVKRLERLMYLFLEGGLHGQDPESPAGKAIQAAQAQMNHPSIRPLIDEQTPLQKTAMLNEFMAWTLANKNIAATLETVKVTDRLAKLTRAAWNQIKRLIWGDKRAPAGMGQGSDMLSQIRFNTAILTESQMSLAEQLSDVQLAHAVLTDKLDRPGRMQHTADAFIALIATHLGETYSEEFKKNLHNHPRMEHAIKQAKGLLAEASQHFNLDPVEQSIFTTIAAAFSTEAQLAPAALREMSKVYEQFLDKASQEMFEDPSEPDPQVRAYAARNRYRFLQGMTGSPELGTDAHGRSTALGVFVALATTSESLGKVLEQMGHSEVTPSALDQNQQELSTLDRVLKKLSTKLFQSLSRRLTGLNQASAPNLKVAVDQLTDVVIEEAFRSKTLIENWSEFTRSNTQKLNKYVTSKLTMQGLKARARAEKYSQSTSRLDKSLAAVNKGLALMFSRRDSAMALEAALAAQDRNPDIHPFIRELLGPDGIIGRVASQREVYDKIKVVRGRLQQFRQNYLDFVPMLLRAQYKNGELYESSQDMLYRVMGRADLLALATGGRTVEAAVDLASDSTARKAEIKRLEQQVQSYQSDPKYRRLWMDKINQQVNYMLTGEHGNRRLRNANAIAQLSGFEKDPKSWKKPNKQIIQDIDQLLTLKYIDGLPSQDLEKFSTLLNNERDGVLFTANYLLAQRETELEKANTGLAKYNYEKGGLPHETGAGHLLVASDKEHASLVSRGYTRIGKYKGSSVESGVGSRSYYWSPDGGLTTGYNQGLIQNVQGTAYGVYTETGRSTGPTAGYITDPDLVAIYAKRLKRELPGENLSPVFDETGEVIIALERTMDPKHLKLNQVPQHLGNIIGRWQGRQVEEKMAEDMNKEVIKALAAQWKRDEFTDNADRYEDLLLSEDPVVKDALSIMPHSVRALIEQEFGGERFMVTRGQINQAIGFRQASVADLWTGNTRMAKERQEFIRNTLEAMLGEDAFRKAVRFERNWQSTINSVRTNIVVRSLVVPAANIISGIYQLAIRGIPMLTIMTELPKKLVEIEEYSQLIKRRVALEAKAHADPVMAKTYEATIRELDARMKRLTIWPLIESGEFSAIADVGLVAQQEIDVHGAITGQKTWMEQLEAAVDKLPVEARNVARYGYISKHTALYQWLQKSIQYSDFVMKAVHYDHLIKHEHDLLEDTQEYQDVLLETLKTEPDVKQARAIAREAVARGIITEEFNNYDLPSGRGRAYLESIGLGWFLNYKIRSTKVGMNMLRNNPVHWLLFSMLPHPMSAGIPITDNLLVQTFGGGIMFSLGPQMLTHPISINPWYNLFGD